MIWFGERERNLAKLSMTTFTYHSTSSLFYGLNSSRRSIIGAGWAGPGWCWASRGPAGSTSVRLSAGPARPRTGPAGPRLGPAHAMSCWPVPGNLISCFCGQKLIDKLNETSFLQARSGQCCAFRGRLCPLFC